MGLRLSSAARNAAGDAIAALLEGAAGSICVYSGSQPANPDASATGTLLVEFDLPDPAYGTFASGTGTLGSVADAEAVASGTAGWVRVKDNAGAGVLDGVAATSGAFLTLDTLSIVSGGTVTISSGSLTMPQGS